MLIWETKISPDDTFIKQKSPTNYEGEVEDLDNSSYRSVVSGNLIDTVVSYAWSKLSFSYDYLTSEEIKPLMALLKQNPIYVKATDPSLGEEFKEMKMRCSRKKWKMLETGDYTLSFNLVQKEKVSGQ